jgi:antirestriction protein ArdC
MKFSPLEKVMSSRKQLVESILGNLKKDNQILPPNWNKSAMRPQNPASNVYYRGGNRFRLMNAAIENGYKDPRWCTYIQAKQNGWQVRKGARGVLCEKWIFSKEIEEIGSDGKVALDKEGQPIKKIIQLEKPLVNYFIVFNGEDINGMPKLELPSLSYDESLKLAESFIQSSECVIKEIAQDQAYYDPFKDIIVTPIKESFITSADFLRTTLHEMAHSTGHSNRLNRPLMNMFGTPDYAREELNAEIGAIFTKCDLGIEFEEDGYIEERHRQYIKSWISMFENDPNEFYCACANADKISHHLIQHYEHYQELQKTNEQLLDINPNNYDYMTIINDELKNNHYTCNNIILNNIKNLNEITGQQHTLKDIHNKYYSMNSLSKEEQTIILELGRELQYQELHRQQQTIQIALAPEC